MKKNYKDRRVPRYSTPFLLVLTWYGTLVTKCEPLLRNNNLRICAIDLMDMSLS